MSRADGHSPIRQGSKLGQGGACAVFEGDEIGTGKRWAVKVPLRPTGEPGLLAQFDASRGLEHPNVARSVRLARDVEGQLLCLQTMVDGPALTHRLPLAEGLRPVVALGIARGLAAIHGWGTLHGDLSPDNVLLADGSRPVLIDYGFTPDPRADAYGTPGYIAPEVLRGELFTAASDVYSAGCVLFEVLVGRPLYSAISAGVRAHQHLSSPPDLPESLDAELSALLAGALAKDPTARPSVFQLLEWLEDALGEPADPALASSLLHPRGGPAGALSDRFKEALERQASGMGSVHVLSGGHGDDCEHWGHWLVREAIGTVPVWVVPGGGDTLMQRLCAVVDAGFGSAPDPVMALARALDRYCAQAPLTLVVDARSADGAVLQQVWESLTTAAGATPLLALVLAPADSPVGNRQQRVGIDPLTPNECRDLLDDVLGTDSGAVTDLRQWVMGIEGTTTADVIRLLRETHVQGALAYRRGQWLLDQGTFSARRDEIAQVAVTGEAVVDALPPLWVRTLAALDALDRPPSLAALEAALATPEGFSGAIDQMVNAGLIARSLDSIRIRDRRAARQSYLRLSSAGRATLHSGLLAHVRPTGDYGELMVFRGLHSTLAGAEIELDDAVAMVDELVSRRQVRWAIQLLDCLVARRWMQRSAAARLALARGRLLVSQGDTVQARQVLSEVDPAGDQDALVSLGEQLIRCGAHEQASRVLSASATSPAAHLTLARSLLYTGKSAEAQSLAESLTIDAVPRDVYAGACHLRATCLWHSGRADEAEALAVEGLQAAGDDRALRADLFRAAGISRFYQSNFGGAREALAQATTENRALGRIPELAKCLNNLAMVDYGRGRWSRAAETWEEFKLLCARVADPIELANACNNLGYLRLRLGQHHRAIALFERCLQVATDAAYTRLVPVARSNLAEAQLWLGELDVAGETLEVARAEVARNPNPQVAAELERRWAEWLLADGQVLSALVHARTQLDEAPEGAEAGHLLLTLAECYRHTGDLEDAEEHARLALSTLEERDARFDVALARGGLANVLAEQGRPFEAANEARLSLDAFLELGARAHADKAFETHRCLVRTTMQSPQDLQAGRAIIDVALQLGATLDLDQLVPLVLERVVQIVNAERGLFALYGPDGEVTEAVLHNLVWNGPGSPLPVSSSVLNQARLTGRVVVVQDVETEGDYQSRVSVRLLGLRSMLGVPVVVNSRVVGVIYVDSRKETIHDIQRDVEMLGALAGLVGVCVENARLFSEHRFRTHLLAAMAHDFRAPLSVIQVNARMLNDTQQALDDREMLAEIAGGAIRMLRMVDNALELSSEGQGVNEPIVPFDLNEEFTHHVNQLSALAETYQLELDVQVAHDLDQMLTRPERLRVVLDNLIFNAIKFAKPGSTITVSARRRGDIGPAPVQGVRDVDSMFRQDRVLRCADGSDFVEFTVHNLGRPIPDDVLARLFQPFNRDAVRKTGVRSTGLGLAIAHGCVRQLGGRIWVESARTTGTRFTFTLPAELAEADAQVVSIARAAG